MTAAEPEVIDAAVLTPPRALLFDWDNTLVDTWPCIGRATNITLTRMGLEPWSEAEIRTRVAGSLRDTFPAIYGDRWEEARDVYYRAFEEVHLEMLLPLPGAAALLDAAVAAGLYMGVVSNKVGSYLRRELAHLGWERYFGRAVGAQDAARDKPAPEPIWLVLEGSGIAAGPSVWFVGDGPIDVACGTAAGCTTVLIHGAPVGASVAGPHNPDGEAADCAALQRLMARALASTSR